MDLITISFALISASCMYACVILWLDRRDIQRFAVEATATASMRERMADLEARVGAVRLDATAIAGELERVDASLKSHVQRQNAYRSAETRSATRDRIIEELTDQMHQQPAPQQLPEPPHMDAYEIMRKRNGTTN